MSAFGISIDEARVCIFAEGVSKKDALDQLAGAVAKAAHIPEPEGLRQAIGIREACKSTGIGGGCAIPHVYMETVKNTVVGVGISHDGIAFDAMDGLPVQIVILFIMPHGRNREYLELLAQVTGAMKTPGFASRLIACSTPAEVVSVLGKSGG
jgi:mannitol/fructose-specific phosphotransferase system IIA component (Ntr-type)